MTEYSQWLQTIIDDLNYDTVIESPWRVEFVGAEGKHQTMGNSRKLIKEGIWVGVLNKELGEFPTIRQQLENAQKIVKVMSRGKIQLPPSS